ncbi:Peptidyl-prolyl cis-trans isomerase [Aphelenchoides besseyi]|nr:Peptidyl-prolyl cis-trans isomerase [Aphelenchoides besseyi]
MKLVRFAFAGAMFAGALAASTFASAAELLTVQLKDGPVVIELMPDVAPNHVAQIEALAKKGAYDNVAFHRVIDGFMAQTGDVQYGNMEKGFSAQRAGTGGSDLPDYSGRILQGSLHARGWSAWPAHRIRIPPIRSSSSCLPTVRS